MDIAIRIPRLDDINHIAYVANNPDVCKFMVDFSYPYDKEKWLLFLKYAIDWFNSHTSCHFVITYRWIPIGIIWWEAIPGDSIEIGCWLWKNYWWKWYSWIAFDLFLKFIIWEYPGYKYVLAKANVKNIKSIKFLKKKWFKQIEQKENLIYFSYSIY